MRRLLLGIAIALPLVVAAQSPLLAWRDPLYIASSFFAILAMGLMLAQPMLVAGWLDRLDPRQARRIHRLTGLALIIAVFGHIAGLWITSPPDVIDVLLFRSPAPFSLWGALALWTLLIAAGLALLRKRLRVPPRLFRRGHAALTTAAVGCTILHIVLIEGTLTWPVKVALSAALVITIGMAIFQLRVFARRQI